MQLLQRRSLLRSLNAGKDVARNISRYGLEFTKDYGDPGKRAGRRPRDPGCHQLRLH